MIKFGKTIALAPFVIIIGCEDNDVANAPSVYLPSQSSIISVPTTASRFTGRVVGVTDGDTISVMRDGKAVKVRLAGIDCPEKTQPYGNAAKQFTSNFAFSKDIAVAITDKDRYGRLVGYVISTDGRCLNAELLSAGLAWWYKQYSNDKRLEAIEQDARNRKAGLWADKSPIPPWDFRRKPSPKSGR